MIPKTMLLVLIGLPGIGQAAELPAQPSPPDPMFDDTIAVSAGIGYATDSTRVRLDATDGTPGTTVNAERELGLPSGRLAGQVDVALRPRPRHRFLAGFDVPPADRRATRVLSGDIRFRDQLYLAGETVQSQMKLRRWWASYAYSVLRSPRAELALGLGITTLDVYAEAGVPARAIRETEERTVPAPQGSLEATYRFSPRWYGQARFQYVSFSADRSRGSLRQLEVAALFQFNPALSAGIRYSRLDARASIVDTGDSGLFRYATGSPQLFLRASF